MTLPSSGPLSIQQIATEFGGTAPHSLNEYYGKAPGIPTSGTISIQDFYGKSSEKVWTLTKIPTNTTNTLYSVGYLRSAGRMGAVGAGGVMFHFVSGDASATPATTGTAATLYAIGDWSGSVVGGGAYASIIIGGQGIVRTGDMSINTNTITWASQTTGISVVRNAPVQSGSWFIMGDSGLARYRNGSLDSGQSATWTACTTNTSQPLYSGALLKDYVGKYIVCGAAGTVRSAAYNPSSAAWTALSSGVSVNLNSVACASSYDSPSASTVIVGDNGTILASTEADPTGFFAVSSPVSTHLRGVAPPSKPGNPWFIVGDNGVLLKGNGISFTKITTGVTTNFRSIATLFNVTDPYYALVGDNGAIYTLT